MPIGYEADEFGEAVLTAASARRLRKIAQVRRIVARLADFAAAAPYSDEEPEERFGHHERIDENHPAPEAQQPLWAVIERLTDQLPLLECRLLEWRFGVRGADRLPVGAIAHKLGCSVRTVELRLKSLYEKLRLSEYAGAQLDGNTAVLWDCE
ncbi:MAG: hypothetical protein ABIP48_22845 [Planctomycetota bacterium]